MGRYVVIALALAIAACNNPAKPGVLTVKSVKIDGLTVFSALNQTSQLSATATLSSDERIAVTDKVTWSTANSAIASISSAGQLKSVDYGTTTVTAAFQAVDGVVTGTAQVQIAIVPTALTINNRADLTDVGQTIQLSATATLQDGSTKDVTALATWLSGDARVLAPATGGVFTATGLGLVNVTARYTSAGKTVSRTVMIAVTPPGTFALRGRVRDPGAGDLDGVSIVHQPTGRSASSVAGGFTIGGLTAGTLSFSKPGYEAPPLQVTPAVSGGFVDVPLQPIIRFAAGESRSAQIAPHDMDYLVGATRCYPCNLVHITASPTGKFHIDVTWTETHTALKMWINGTQFDGPLAGPGTISADVSPGNAELDVYIGQLSNESATYVSFTIVTQIR